MAGQARNSRFVENFDDDASESSSSSESLSPSTPSPRPTSQASLSPEPIVGLFSALSLKETTSRCPESHCKDLRCLQSHAQDGQPAEAEAEVGTSFESLLARLKNHQERKNVQKPEPGAGHNKSNIIIDRSSIEASNAVLNKMVEEQHGDPKSRLSKDDNELDIEVKIERLVQDLERFNEQRFEIYRKFQVCFAYHEQINESPKTCLECLRHLQNIEKNYSEARSRVASIGIELMLASDLDPAVVCKHVPDYADAFAEKHRHVPNIFLERLRLLRHMLNSLTRDVEKARGWQDLWTDTFVPEQPHGHGQDEKPNIGEEAKEGPEQNEAKEEPSSKSLTTKDYQDARSENAESYKAREKSRKSRPKRRGNEKRNLTSA